MQNGFIHQDKEEFKKQLIAPILAKSVKYQEFVIKIAEQEEKWKGKEVDINNCNQIIEEIKLSNSMLVEKNDYKDVIFNFYLFFKQIEFFLEKEASQNIHEVEQFKLAKKYFEEADFSTADKLIDDNWIDELFIDFSQKNEVKGDYSEEQKAEIKFIILLLAIKISMPMFTLDLFLVPSKEYLDKIYNRIKRIFVLFQEPSLIKYMMTLISFLSTSDEKEQMIKEIENLKNEIKNHTPQGTEESRLETNALFSFMIGDFYMQENRNLDKALTYFEQSLMDYQKLVSINPLKYFPLMAKSYKYMGHIYSRKNEYDLALFFYDKSLILRKQLYKIDPEKQLFEYADERFYLVTYQYKKLRNIDKSVELAEKLLEDLIEINENDNQEHIYLTAYMTRTLKFMIALELKDEQ